MPKNAILIEAASDFWAGDTVAGTVVLHLVKTTPIRGIRVRLHGDEEASWRVGTGKGSDYYEEKRVIVDEEQTLHGGPALAGAKLVVDSIQGFFAKDKYEQLPPGEYRYRFALKLPANIPGSYQSEINKNTHSMVKYTLTAQADLPLKRDLRVVRWLDVREVTPAEEPRATSARETKQAFLSREPVAELAAHLDKTSYREGEQVMCRVEVTNHSPNKKLRGVKVAIHQIEEGKSRHGYMLVKGNYSYRQRKEIGQGKFAPKEFPFKSTMTGQVKMDLPEELPPTRTAPGLIKLDYEIEATLEIPWAKDIKITLPLKIQTKPKPLTIKEWRAKLKSLFGEKVQNDLFNDLPAEEFKKAMGPPGDTNTVEGTPYWYYDCEDGMLQLEMDAQLLKKEGLMRGTIYEED